MSHERRIDALDGVRGLAYLIVFFDHTVPAHAPGGNTGVDLFFVLSGFLITTILLKEQKRFGAIDIAKFYLRRALRLLPALYLLAAMCILYLWLFEPEAKLTTALNGLPSLLFYYYNWYIIRVPGGGSALFPHLWSLSVEEQFYIVWPFVLSLALWRGGRTFDIVLAIGIIGPAVARLVLWDGQWSSQYYLTHLRIDTLMWGALAARLVAANWMPKDGMGRENVGVAAIIAFAVVILFALIPNRINGVMSLGGYTVYGIAAAFLIAVVATVPPTPLRALLSFGPLRWTGTISYGLYLWHVPLMYYVHTYGVPYGNYRNTAAFIGAYVAATISYYVMERPLLRLKDRIGTPRETKLRTELAASPAE